MGIFVTKSASWWASHGPFEAPAILDRSAARRASPITRACAHVIERLGPFGRETPIVFGSTAGDIDGLFALLEQMHSEQGGLSPIGFSRSVHHAPATTVGISVGHLGPVVGVSANEDLAAMALLEALSLAQVHGSAIVAVAEVEWPTAFDADTFEAYAAALLLGPVEGCSLNLEASGAGHLDEALEPGLRSNPAARLEHVLRWAPAAQPGDSVSLSPRRSGSWRVTCLS